MTGIGSHWMRLLAAGIRPGIKSVDNYGPCFELAALGPDSDIIFRLSTAGQGDGYDYDVPDYSLPPAQAAAVHWQATLAKLPPGFDKSKVWLEPINEVDKERADWLGNFAWEIGQLALRDGYKVALFGWASGEPEPADWETPGMLRYLQLAAQYPERLAVAQHEYSYTTASLENSQPAPYPFQVGRFRFLHEACDRRGIRRPTIFITEFGWEYERVPTPAVAIEHLRWAADVYAVHANIRFVAIWYLGAGFGGIANQAQRLIAPVTDLALSYQAPPPEEPPAPPAPAPSGRGAPRIQYPRTYILLPPGAGLPWVEAAARATWDKDRTTIGGAADDAGIGDLDVRKVIAVNPAAWGPGEDGAGLVGFYQRYYPGVIYEPVEAGTPAQLESILSGGPGQPPPTPFTVQAWPTTIKQVNQFFGERPEYYAQFGLPGHEGIDLVSPLGTPYFCVAPGTVVWVSDKKRSNPSQPSNYGWHMIVQHANGYSTLYAHAKPNPPVSAGQVVSAGDILGYSGTTGNSSGPHLHITFQQQGAQLPGGWPPGYIDPWPFLKGLHDQLDAPVPPLTRGYLWSPGLDIRLNSLALTQSNLNLRAQPSSSAPRPGTVKVYSVVKVVNAAPQNGYLLCDASLGQQSPPPPPAGTARLGLHASADPGNLTEAEFAEFRDTRPGVIKVLSAHAGPSIARLVAEHPGAAVIVRAFLDFGGRNISPAQFYGDTIVDLERALGAIGAGRPVIIELHNEPNLTDEGLGSSWANGADFAAWWIATLTLFKQRLPGRRFMYPGLSPGPSISGIRLDHKQFIEASRSAVNAADALGIHLYWGDNDPMSNAIATLDDYRARFPGKEIWITEASNKASGITAAQQAGSYVQFWRAVGGRAAGITFFVASASDPTFAREVWVGRGIGKVVGGR